MKEWFEDYSVEMSVGDGRWVRFTKVIKVQYDQNTISAKGEIKERNINNVLVDCIIGNKPTLLFGDEDKFRFL